MRRKIAAGKWLPSKTLPIVYGKFFSQTRSTTFAGANRRTITLGIEMIIVHKVTVAFLETEGIRLNKDTPRASKHLQHAPLSSSTQYIRFKQTSSLASSSAQQMRSKDPLGLDSAAKWVKSAVDGLGANLSPKAIPVPLLTTYPY